MNSFCSQALKLVEFLLLAIFWIAAALEDGVVRQFGKDLKLVSLTWDCFECDYPVITIDFPAPNQAKAIDAEIPVCSRR